jgi:cobalt/nickel transport system permease protein
LHIQDGIIQSGVVLATGAVLAAAGTACGLARLEHEQIPRVGLMAAVFFVASLLHVPLGPTSAHLVMIGLLGLLLGWAAFPAVLVGLILHALLFQYGGVTTLGINTFIMAAPAVLCGAAVRPLMRCRGVGPGVAGFLAGAGAVMLAGLLTAGVLLWAGEEFLVSARIVLAAHLPVMLVEGVICTFCTAYLMRVKPQMFLGEPPNATQ